MQAQQAAMAHNKNKGTRAISTQICRPLQCVMNRQTALLE
jgi:hypothetical protein